MAEFSNLCCCVATTVEQEESMKLIQSILKNENDNECLLFSGILSLVAADTSSSSPRREPLPPLQIPLQGRMDSCVKGLSKDQDIVRTGKKGEEYFWIVCCDGHGNNTFVDILKHLDWREIMEQPNSYYQMQYKLSKYSYSILSGSTLCMVKIFADKIECVSVGDSRILVYKNGEMEYTNTSHNYSKEAEQERLAASATTNVSVKYDMFPAIATGSTRKQKQLSYVTYTDKTNPNKKVTLAMTQSIGHYNITGFAPEFKTIPYSSDTDHIRVIVGTDGFFDMCLVTESTGDSPEEQEGRDADKEDLLTLNALLLATKAELRWKQVWKYYYGGEKRPELFQETKFDKNSIDDIAIAVWHN